MKQFLQGSLLVVVFLLIPYFLIEGHGIVESILVSILVMAVLSIFGIIFGAINRRLK